MVKKDKVNIIRNTDFDEIDLDLSEAMSQLDDTNVRIKELLESETCDQEGDPGQLEIEATKTEAPNDPPAQPENSAHAAP